MSDLEPGETIDLGTRVGGGPTIYRDRNCEDVFAIGGHGGELDRGEIRQLAEVAGFEVSDE